MNRTTPQHLNQPKVPILVVEDHIVVREGLAALINREKDMVVCGETDTGTGALKLIQQLKPRLVVADMLLREGNGIDLVKSAKALYPEVLFLILSMQDEELYAERCIRAGANGYIMKSAASDIFLDAIRMVLAGEIYISRKMNVRLLHKMADQNLPNSSSELAGLTDREIQIFQMIGAGMNTKDMAVKLGISPKTVATHRENLKIKLGTKDGRGLDLMAMRWLENNQTSR